MPCASGSRRSTDRRKALGGLQLQVFELIFRGRNAGLDVLGDLVWLRVLYRAGGNRSNSACSADLLDHRCLTGLDKSVVEISHLIVRQFLDGSEKERKGRLVGEVWPKEVGSCCEGKDVPVFEVVGGSFVLDLAIGLVRDEGAIGDRVDVDSLGDVVAPQ